MRPTVDLCSTIDGDLLIDSFSRQSGYGHHYLRTHLPVPHNASADCPGTGIYLIVVGCGIVG